MRKLILAVCCIGLLSLAGCSNHIAIEQHPETPEEKACVQKVSKELISNTPKSLAGHDQDWDDALKMAYVVASEMCCDRRGYERTANGMATGKMILVK